MVEDTPPPYRMRNDSENSEWVQASRELSYVSSVEITAVVCLAHYRHTKLFFLNKDFEIKGIDSKSEEFFEVQKAAFNLCLIRLTFPGDSHASEGLVFFPNLGAKVKMT